MSWEDQGRQYHMWFGSGTAPGKGKPAAPDPSVIGKSVPDRVLALAYGAVASFPAGQRGRVEGQFHTGTLPRLKEAITAWMGATQLGLTAFAPQFLGRSAADPVAINLYRAAAGARYATSQGDLREAAGKLAEAIKAVGVSQWPRFVTDAVQRARDPATVAAVEKSNQPPDYRRDAITPVYPVETAIGIAVAGSIAGPAAAARALIGAGVKQTLPYGQPLADNTAENVPTPGTLAGNAIEEVEPSNPSLPARPDDLLAQGWDETSHPEAARMGHRTFENPKTGEVIRFDQGRRGAPGFEGQDHYHRLNPNSTSNRDKYLDQNGVPAARGSNLSHIPPGSL